MIANDRILQMLSKDVDPQKWEVIRGDIHIRELVDQFSRSELELDHSRKYTILAIKPCGVLARKASATLSWLLKQGFDVVAFDTARITAEKSRLLWHWQLHKATRYRLWVMDNILNSTETIILVLRHQSSTSASALLSENKGPADASRQRPGQLRHMLKPEAYLLNFVHTADDPIDMYRDLYILKGIEYATSMARAIEKDAMAALDPGVVRRKILDVEFRSLHHDLSLPSALEGLSKASQSRSTLDENQARALILASFSRLTERSASNLIADAPVHMAVAAAHLFEMSIPGASDPFASRSGTK
ncbi:nucleoside-diphosphate kinase [Rhodococcus sp. P1Y]|uniref:nucleoside-diphosphate kinase n=1 Tax=Rhodococcus sp. P1Y TaxID=1302308 RepID=UPI000EB17FCA|nr:nucleoside-diphosphate kinase [Rhodococcus sp. P1Y]AYJ47350.1 hypothetical protein D8W71_02175 [Rhodococcus sp. P1Y]